MAVEILDFRECKKNTLRGFAKVKLPQTGPVIDGITIHEKNGSRWAGMPARAYEDNKGETKWSRVCYFEARDVWDAF